MGRGSDLPFDFKGELTVRHVPLDGDYDPGGTYWGGPDNLYLVTDSEGRERYLRVGGRTGEVESVDGAKALFPSATFPVPSEVSATDIDDMLAGYISAALFSMTGDDDKPLDDKYTDLDLSSESKAKMRADCERFARDNSAALLASMGQKGRYASVFASWDLAGYYLFLERGGAGVGFWGGTWPEPYDAALSDACEGLGEVNLYVGDDGKIYT
jgi:hypothetical protein